MYLISQCKIIVIHAKTSHILLSKWLRACHTSLLVISVQKIQVLAMFGLIAQVTCLHVKKNHKQNPPKSNNKPLAIGHTFSALQEMFTPMQWGTFSEIIKHETWNLNLLCMTSMEVFWPINNFINFFSENLAFDF